MIEKNASLVTARNLTTLVLFFEVTDNQLCAAAGLFGLKSEITSHFSRWMWMCPSGEGRLLLVGRGMKMKL
jgi:hypothetical protein